MLEGFLSTLVSPHPPKKFEPAKPDPGGFPMFDCILKDFVFQPEGAQGIEDQSHAQNSQAN